MTDGKSVHNITWARDMARRLRFPAEVLNVERVTKHAFIFTVFAAFCMPTIAFAGPSKLIISADAVPNRYIVVLNDPKLTDIMSQMLVSRHLSSALSVSTRKAINNLATTETNRVVGTLAAKYGGVVEDIYPMVLGGYSAEMSLKEAQSLSADPNVKYVASVGKVYALSAGSENNPYWGLDRIDQRSPTLDHTYNYLNCGKGITAYVVDTGIRFTSGEFEGRAQPGFDALQLNADSSDSDWFGHGTFVAGIIGGATYGVAKQASLVSVRVLARDDQPGNWAQVLAGINWITANFHAPGVVNMSIGGSPDPSNGVETAIQQSMASGLTYVAAAGNDDDDATTECPSDIPGVITVGAMGMPDFCASFSNFGPKVDVFAPGIDVTSVGNLSDADTEEMDGTSASAPYVAGWVALYLNANKGALPGDVAAALKAHATPGVLSSVDSHTHNYLLYTMDPTDTLPH